MIRKAHSPAYISIRVLRFVFLLKYMNQGMVEQFVAVSSSHRFCLLLPLGVVFRYFICEAQMLKCKIFLLFSCKYEKYIYLCWVNISNNTNKNKKAMQIKHTVYPAHTLPFNEWAAYIRKQTIPETLRKPLISEHYAQWQRLINPLKQK